MIETYLTDEIVFVSQPRDKYGAATGAPVEVIKPARIERGNRWVRDAKGEQVVSSAKILLKHPPMPGVKIRFDGRDHIVLSADSKRDLGDALFWVVFVA